MKRKFFLLGAALALALAAAAQPVRDNVILRTNHADGIYAKGDTVRVWADVKAVPEKPLVFKVMRWTQWDEESKTAIVLHEGENLLYERVFDESVQYVFEVTDNVKPREFKAEGTGNAFAGVIVAPEEFKVGFSEPKDLLGFWNKEIKKMRKLKMKVDVTKESEKDGFEVRHVDINCVGPAPARAYVAHPKDAKKGTLPIILYLHAAGSPGAPSQARTALFYANCVEGGALAMDLNAHGMLDDQPKEYYDNLSNSLLKGYSSREPDGLDNYYFKWMMLRAIRALDYLTKDPLWDGRHVIVSGTSQGGYQSAVLSVLDKRVTTAILTVPAGIDQGGSLQGRTASWPYTMRKYPESTQKYSPYMDPAAWLYRTKADIWCEIGLFDFTCPGANLFAALNTVKTPVTIVTFQRPHSGYMDRSHKAVDKERMDYFQKAAVK